MHNCAILMLLCVTTGCATAQTFRVVDAETGQPVAGVRAERCVRALQPATVFPLWVTIPWTQEEAISDESGSGRFTEEGSYFRFDKDGYQPVFVDQGWRGFQSGQLESDGTLTVPLSKDEETDSTSD